MFFVSAFVLAGAILTFRALEKPEPLRRSKIAALMLFTVFAWSQAGVFLFSANHGGAVTLQDARTMAAMFAVMGFMPVGLAVLVARKRM